MVLQVHSSMYDQNLFPARTKNWHNSTTGKKVPIAHVKRGQVPPAHAKRVFGRWWVVRPVEYWRGVFYAQGGERVQIPEGRAYIKLLFQAYIPPAEKNQICSNVDMSTDFISVDFSRQKKYRQMSRQTVDRFGFLGHPNRPRDKATIRLASIYNPQIEAKSHVTSGGSTNHFYCCVD